MGLSTDILVKRSNGAFDATWLNAVESGARVERRQLDSLAALLQIQPSDVILVEDQRPPYRGLLAFEPADMDLFGGRDRVSLEILSLLLDRRIVTLNGASGSGKSSVIKAGVVPRLLSDRTQVWRGLVMRPGSDPLIGLAKALGGEIDRDLNEDERIISTKKRAKTLLEGEATLSDYMTAIAELAAQRYGSRPRLLLFVDQWEELYTQTTSSKSRSVFVDNLLQAFRQGSDRLILTVRADFTDQLLEDRRDLFDAIAPGIKLLPRMRAEDLKEAICKPAESVGYGLDDDLVDQMIDDAGDEPGALALVQFLLTQIWERRDTSMRRLKMDAYIAVGGLKGAIDRHADAIFGNLPQQKQIDARRALTRLVHVTPLGAYARKRLSVNQFDRGSQAALFFLAEQSNRLVVISRDEQLQQDMVEVAHEAVIREWSTLRNWIAEDPSFFAWRDQIERLKERWLEKGKRRRDLLRGSNLDDAESFVRRVSEPASSGSKEIPESTTEYIDLSRQHLTQMRMLAASLMVILFIVSVGVSITMSRLRDSAEASARESVVSETQALSALARSEVANQNSLAALVYALRALPSQAYPRPFYDSVVTTLSSVLSSRELPQAQSSAAIDSEIGISDGQLLLRTEQGDILQWSIESGASRLNINLDLEGEIEPILLSGGKLLGFGKDKAVHLWNIADQSDAVVPLRFNAGIEGLYSIDSERVAIQDGGTLKFYSLRSGKTYGEHINTAYKGLKLKSGAFLFKTDVSLLLVDGRAGKLIGEPIPISDNFSVITEVSPNLIAATNWSEEILLLNLTDRTTTKIATIAAQATKVERIAEGLVVVFSGEKMLIIDISKDDHPAQEIALDGQASDFVPVSSDTVLVISSETAELWNIHTGEQVGRSMQHDGQSIDGAMVTRGGRLITWGRDGALRSWDRATGDPSSAPMFHGGPVLGVAELEGGQLVSWAVDRSVKVWGPSYLIDERLAQNVAETKSQGLNSFGERESVAFVLGADNSGLDVEGAQILENEELLTWNSTGIMKISYPRTYLQRGGDFAHHGEISDVLELDDGNILTWGGMTVRLWSRQSLKEIGTPLVTDEQIGNVLVVSQSSIATWSRAGKIYLWNFLTPRAKPQTLEIGHELELVSTLADKKLLILTDDMRVSFFDLEMGMYSGGDFRVELESPISGAMLVDEEFLIAWSQNNEIVVWRVSNKPQFLWRGRHVTNDPRGIGILIVEGAGLFSTSSDGAIRHWDLRSGDQIGKTMNHETGDIHGIVLTDGGSLLSWGRDATVRMWDPRSGDQVGRTIIHAGRGFASTYGVIDVVKIPDDRIITISNNGVAKVWDVLNGYQIGQIYLAGIDSVIPTGRSRLLVKSEGGWNVLRMGWPSGNIIQIACDAALQRLLPADPASRSAVASSCQSAPRGLIQYSKQHFTLN